MAENAIKNKYLHDFLLQSEISYFTKILSKVKMEGGAIFPDVIAYAMVLEKLTLAMRNDWKILEACNQVWRGKLSTIILSFNLKIQSIFSYIHARILCFTLKFLLEKLICIFFHSISLSEFQCRK